MDSPHSSTEHGSSVPPQYRGLPAEIVDEIWIPKIYVDPEKTAVERAHKERALRELREEEARARGEEGKEVHALREQLGVAAPVGLTEEQIQAAQKAAWQRAKAHLGDLNTDAMLHRIQPGIGRRFDAHGITKVSITNQLRQLQALLTTGIDPSRPLHTAPLELDDRDKAGAGAGLGTPGGTAYNNGSFILLGPPDGSIARDGICAVIVNDAYYDAIPTLTAAFPQVTFIRADEANETLRAFVEKWDAENHR